MGRREAPLSGPASAYLAALNTHLQAVLDHDEEAELASRTLMADLANGMRLPGDGGERGWQRRRVPQLHDGPWLRRRYVDEGRSGAAIAALLGCTPSAVLHALDRHGIPRRRNRRFGRTRLPLPD